MKKYTRRVRRTVSAEGVTGAIIRPYSLLSKLYRALACPQVSTSITQCLAIYIEANPSSPPDPQIPIRLPDISRVSQPLPKPFLLVAYSSISKRLNLQLFLFIIIFIQTYDIIITLIHLSLSILQYHSNSILQRYNPCKYTCLL